MPSQPDQYHPRTAVASRWCDFLVVNIVIIVGEARDQALKNAEVLNALGPDGLLVNVARSTVIYAAALISALAERRNAGAGLDAYKLNVPAELMALDNVVLLPHAASATHDGRQEVA